jgi:chromosome segregation ATPase
LESTNQVYRYSCLIYELYKLQFLTEDKLNQSQTNVVKLEKELRAEKDRGQELGERILELEALSATQQSKLKSTHEQLDMLQVGIQKIQTASQRIVELELIMETVYNQIVKEQTVDIQYSVIGVSHLQNVLCTQFS